MKALYVNGFVEWNEEKSFVAEVHSLFEYKEESRSVLMQFLGLPFEMTGMFQSL
jgi:hypothetical protein